MKLNKRIIAFVLTLAMAFNMAIPVFATSASTTEAESVAPQNEEKAQEFQAEVKPGNDVVLEFVYENARGFEADIKLSNPNAITGKKDIKLEILEFGEYENNFFQITANPDTEGYHYKLMAFSWDDNGIALDKMTVRITLTISETVPIEEITVSLRYVIACGKNESYGPLNGDDLPDDIGKITVIPPTDYIRLNQLIAQAENLNEADYDPAEWLVLENALADAYDALEIDDQTTVDNAADALEAAIWALNKLDYSELISNITAARLKIEKQYTKASWQNLQTKLENAEYVRDNSKVQAEIDEAAAELAQAIEDLVPSPDRTFLLDQIDRAEALNNKEHNIKSYFIGG